MKTPYADAERMLLNMVIEKERIYIHNVANRMKYNYIKKNNRS